MSEYQSLQVLKSAALSDQSVLSVTSQKNYWIVIVLTYLVIQAKT